MSYNLQSSYNMQALAELLPDLKKCGHRVLIFSQWTSMLDILEWTLDVLGVTYRRLDGRFATIYLSDIHYNYCYREQLFSASGMLT